MVFALLAKQLVDELSSAHGVVRLDALSLARLAQAVFVESVDVHTRMLEDGVAHGHAGVGGEVDRVLPEGTSVVPWTAWASSPNGFSVVSIIQW